MKRASWIVTERPWRRGGAVAKAKTTAEWNATSGFVPEAGEIIIYTDYQTVTEGGETRYIPGVKIGSGNGYVQDHPGN